MAEAMEAMRRQLEAAFWGHTFVVVGIIAGFALLMASILSPVPVFWQYLILAVVVIVLSLIWALWRDIPKSAKYACSSIILIGFAWLLYNSLAVEFNWPAAQVPMTDLELAAQYPGPLLMEGAIKMAKAIITGGVVSLWLFAAGVAGLLSAARS